MAWPRKITQKTGMYALCVLHTEFETKHHMILTLCSPEPLSTDGCKSGDSQTLPGY